jgi:hypothetical protein
MILFLIAISPLKPITKHSLLFLSTRPTRVVANWLSIICEYTFDIIHVPGATNICPDSLSRLYADTVWGCRNRFRPTTGAPQEQLFALSSAPVTDAQRQLIMAVHEQGHFGVLATMEALRLRARPSTSCEGMSLQLPDMSSLDSKQVAIWPTDVTVTTLAVSDGPIKYNLIW